MGGKLIPEPRSVCQLPCEVNAKKETDNALDGGSALELTTHNYGHDEWWLLLDAVPQLSPS